MTSSDDSSLNLFVSSSESSLSDHNNGKKRGLFVSMAEETTVKNKKQKKKIEVPMEKKYSFRNMDLPISPFVISGDQAVEEKENDANIEESEDETENKDLEEIKSKAHIKKWYSLILKTRSHPRYKSCYNMNKYKISDTEMADSIDEWVRTKPFSRRFEENPQSIAIDCEMCETKDPVSGLRNPRALCRLSIINGSDENDVLLNTLVKPSWPVIDYRTKINGIGKKHLANVKFTLKHAQDFLLNLCSDETIIIGHALYNDLVSLKLEHSLVVDTSCLYRIKSAGHAFPSLRDVALFNLEMKLLPTHDSIEDARTALRIAEHYRMNDGEVKEVVKSQSLVRVKTEREKRISYKQTLLVHRIPKVCTEKHIKKMFERLVNISPSRVGPIEFKLDQGKSLVHFASENHANSAFNNLSGKPKLEKSGKLQKKVYLKKNLDYINVRKSVVE